MSSPTRLILCPQCQHSFPPPVGTVTACPRCGKVVVIPAPEATAAPPPAIPAEHQASLPVICKLCSSRYYAKPRQMGRMLKCPDCHTENMVVPLAPAAKPIVPEEHDDIPLQPIAVPQRMAPQAKSQPSVVAAPYTNQIPTETVKPPAAPPTDHNDGFNLSAPVELPKYRSLSAESSHLEAALNQQTASQPSSNTKPVSVATTDTPPAVVPSAAAQIRRPWNEVMREPSVPPLPKPASISSPLVPEATEKASPPDKNETHGTWLDSHPFTLGIVSIFRQTQVFARWMSVTILMAAQLAMLWSVNKHLTATGDNDADIGAEHILGLFMLMAMLFSLLPSLMALSSFSLTVFEDTANGDNHISSWPAFNLLEWAQGSMYFLGALGVSGLPGIVVFLSFYGYSSTSLSNSLLMGLPILYLSWFLFFPIIFISMQETGTILEPFSPSILPSFVPLKFSWLVFYGTTFLLSFGTLLFLIPLLYYGYSASNFFLGLPMLIPCAFFVTAFPLVYFRFLGKIAQIYRDYMATVVEEDNGSLDEETDMQAAAIRHAAAHKRH